MGQHDCEFDDPGFASGGLGLGFQYDLNRPLASLAEGTLLDLRRAGDAMMFQSDWLIEMLDEYEIYCIVYDPIKSCRTTWTGLADNRGAAMAACDIATPLIESDMVDQRVVS